MPNAKTQRLVPNTRYIPLAGIGVLRREKLFLSREKRKFYFFASGETQILSFAFFSDANMLVSPTQSSGLGG